MIELALSFEPPFNELTKTLRRTFNFEESITVRELLEHLRNEYGEKFYDLIWDKKIEGEFSPFLSIIINGISYREDDFLNMPLKNQDDITFLYLYFGG
jgi:molybdopterin converting factor small subunit